MRLQCGMGVGTQIAYNGQQGSPERPFDESCCAMNVVLWLPVLFLLGLAVFMLLFAFVAGCEHV